MRPAAPSDLYRRPVMGVASIRWLLRVVRRRTATHTHSDIAIEPRESFNEQLCLNGPAVFIGSCHVLQRRFGTAIHDAASHWKFGRPFVDKNYM
jgi:hypothetical protein